MIFGLTANCAVVSFDFLFAFFTTSLMYAQFAFHFAKRIPPNFDMIQYQSENKYIESHVYSKEEIFELHLVLGLIVQYVQYLVQYSVYWTKTQELFLVD
jgi:hypothetical protein